MIATIGQEPDSGYLRLEQQINWYDGKSIAAQWWYKNVKYLEIAVAAVVPIAAFVARPEITAGVGLAALLLEGLQQINQWQHNWITYRSTCEALRHEKYSFIAKSGVYDGLPDDAAHKLLVERVESLISTEHAKWISQQEYVKRELGQRAYPKQQRSKSKGA